MRRRFSLLAIFIVGCALPATSAIPGFGKGTAVPVRIQTGIKGNYNCSGIAIHKNWALTARHCVDSSMWIENLSVEAPFVPNPNWDLGILYVPGLVSPDVVWTDHKPQIGEAALLVGWGCTQGSGAPRTRTAHVIDIDDRDIYYDVVVCNGDSGGPVYDNQQRLIGLISRKVKSTGLAVVEYLAE